MNTATEPTAQTDSELLEKNRHFYDGLWSDALLVRPEQFNTWPLISELACRYKRRLEIAPGLRPRMPLEGTQFVDISVPALSTLKQSGAQASSASVSKLPFDDRSFDFICALDIIEHVDDDQGALAEISRVATDDAVLLLSSPLHPEWWTPFDDFVGHRRRYTPEGLLELLKQHGFEVQQSAVFGLKPKSSWLTDVGMWFLQHKRKKAMKWYNRVMPYTVRFQKPLAMQSGLIDTENTAEALLLCKKT